ncbi:MAG TPA: GTPase [Acidimicrobiia bacterium]|nr:GTPase [Acidimicrobiia bacterium]
MPPPIAPAARLRADLDALADAVSSAGFGLASIDQEERRDRRDELVGVIRSYLIPRLGDQSAPLIVVVAGPTGSGKSTVVNSLAEREVSRPGPLRPTTRQPVVWCHERHADRYRKFGTVECKVVPDDHPLLGDLTVVDTPDIDSYVADHRRVTAEVLHHADVVIFLTSAQRYADAVPWEILGDIDRRGSIIIYVMNRLNRRASGAVSDYGALLRRNGLEVVEIHSIQEQRVRGEAGMLPGRAMSKLGDELRELASDRQKVLSGVTRRASQYAVDAARNLAGEVEEQELERQRLSAVVERIYEDARAELTAELDRGALIRTEVVDRWSERVGTGEVARWVRGSASWLRGVADRLTGQPAAVVDQIEHEARRELADAIGTRLDRAARAVATAWEVDRSGRELITPDLRTSGEEARLEVGATVDEWLAGLTRMVEEEAPGRFRAARVASTGVNAAAVSTILAVFAATGGITGAEFGVAAGAAAAQQGILEHVLGRAAARSLSGSARDSLLTSIGSVFEAEAARFFRVLKAASDPVELADQIRQAAATVEAESEDFHAR